MESQSNKKPIDEVVFLVKELKKDISQLQTDVSYIKKRLYADHIEKHMKEEKPKEEPKGWFW
jgi:hypothetical protein